MTQNELFPKRKGRDFWSLSKELLLFLKKKEKSNLVKEIPPNSLYIIHYIYPPSPLLHMSKLKALKNRTLSP